MNRLAKENRIRADSKTGKPGTLVLSRTRQSLLPIEELAPHPACIRWQHQSRSRGSPSHAPFVLGVGQDGQGSPKVQMLPGENVRDRVLTDDEESLYPAATKRVGSLRPILNRLCPRVAAVSRNANGRADVDRLFLGGQKIYPEDRNLRLIEVSAT